MKKPPPYRQLRLCVLLTIFVIQCTTVLHAQDEGTGLSVFVDGGGMFPSSKQAGFYSGRPENENTIRRVLYSQAYGPEIWSTLRDQGYLQGIGTYEEIKLADYPEMYYKIGYQIGLGLRYSYNGGWGWMLRAAYARLTAAGVFHLENRPGAGILTNKDQYITCGMYGLENRINIDLALTKRIPLSNNLQIEIALGIDLNNTKVKQNKMEIGGKYYNILNVWGSSELYPGVGEYDYINQGGLGWGGFGSAAVSYAIKGIGSLDIGYTCYYTQTKFKGYNDGNAFAPQHIVYVRANIEKFSFWD